MTGKRLENVRVAAIMTDGFEQIEFTSPRDALIAEGAVVHILAPAGSDEWHIVHGMNHMNPGDRFEIDATIEESNPEDYDAVLLPGGVANADRLRTNESAKDFLRYVNNESKPIFVICHAPWVVISAGLARGRKMTGYHSLKDDLINAGARWVDEPVVVDGNIISSRHPGDLPRFNQQMIEMLSGIDVSAQHAHARKAMEGG